MLFVSEPIELRTAPFLHLHSLALSLFPEQSGREAGRRGPGVTNARAGAGVGRRCGDDPASAALYGITDRRRRIQGSTISPGGTSSRRSSLFHPLAGSRYPTPPSSIHGRSFQRVIQRANKEACSFCSEMCNVRKREGERREGGGEIPRRLTNSLDSRPN